ncbi:hypothetical protein BDV25DRAFT_155961 [Aspergillus avenaceus]|uniref:Uncharacterized protein n=1 Tax=Aspergillus avenaceus TaxID=36643 RepID=A0A5N6TTK0_ASPAV|nr:hypothetical protein BDV25DRAFT_155961 [Aspergillus avenaceus]
MYRLAYFVFTWALKSIATVRLGLFCTLALYLIQEIAQIVIDSDTTSYPYRIYDCI